MTADTFSSTSIPKRIVSEESATRRPRWHGISIFAVLASLYFVVGSVLAVRYNLFDGDGPSRVAHAGFAVMSRDPHLSAIGFVWNPLPSILTIPLMPLKDWWPELKTFGLAGLFQSAGFMAGSVLIVRQIALDRAIAHRWRWIAVVCYGLNPVIVMFGGAGTSEAAELFCVLWCVRHLVLWLDSGHVGNLGWAGVGLGVGYLARYELIPATAGAAALVAAVSFARSRRGSRSQIIFTNVLIVSFPIATAGIVWALTGWIVNGQLLAIVSSQYGNASQVGTALARDGTESLGEPTLWTALVRLTAMQPFVFVAISVAVFVAVKSSRADTLVPVVTLGAILTIALWGEYSRTTFGWFRYYIPAIPMVVAIALLCWKPASSFSFGGRSDAVCRQLGGGLLIASLLIGVPVTARSMLNPDIGNHQLQFGLNSLLNPQRYPPTEQWYRRVGEDDRQLAAYLDQKNLPNGSVLMDTFMNWAVWLSSNKPEQFLIETDYDFNSALNRPWDLGVEYILVTNPKFAAAPDSVTQRYPTLWSDGAGIGILVHSATGAYGQEQWRLYRITKPQRDLDAGTTAPDVSKPSGQPARPRR